MSDTSLPPQPQADAPSQGSHAIDVTALERWRGRQTSAVAKMPSDDAKPHR